MTTNIVFRPYRDSDYQPCMHIFDANCPEFFAPNERREYATFLDNAPEEYHVCEVDGRVRGAFGLMAKSREEKTLNWILLDPQSQGIGIGLKIMEQVIHLGRRSEVTTVNIAASHKSAPFFAMFGAISTTTTPDGWGPGMDRVDMVLPL